MHASNSCAIIIFSWTNNRTNKTHLDQKLEASLVTNIKFGNKFMTISNISKLHMLNEISEKGLFLLKSVYLILYKISTFSTHFSFEIYTYFQYSFFNSI